MAKVVFSLTDSQIELLGRLRGGEQLSFRSADPRTYTSLSGIGLIVAKPDSERWRPRYSLTPAGESAIALCERLAILAPLSDPKAAAKKGRQ